MRTREQRWAARSARGWPRLRVHAIRNGLGALVLGVALVYFTHGLLHFENYPAGDVAWGGRLLALVFAVLVPGVLIPMGAYLVFAGFAARDRGATAAGQARAVVPEDPEAAPVAYRLTRTTPPGVRIRAHRWRRGETGRRYTRELLGALPVQSPVALAPLGMGVIALVAATVHYATGYGRPALVLLAGVAYLGWKLWRGHHSHRAFSDGTWAPSPREDTGPLPATPPAGTTAPVTRLERDDAAPPGRFRPRDEGTAYEPGHRSRETGHGAGDRPREAAYGADRRPRQAGYGVEAPSREEAEYEITDELPVLERIRDTYAEPRGRGSSRGRAAERTEREARAAGRGERGPRDPAAAETTAETVAGRARPAPSERTRPAGRRGVRPEDYTAEQQEQLRRQESYRRELDRRRREQQERTRQAQSGGREEAQSLLGYARSRWRTGRDDR